MLLDYESDAISAVKAGDAVQYIVPEQTILIQTPIAVTAKSSHATQAQAFLNYQWSSAGQTIWAAEGLPARARVGGAAVHEAVPGAAAAVHDRLPRRLDKVEERVLRPVDGLDHQDRAGRGGAHCLQLAPTRRAPPPARSPGAGHAAERRGALGVGLVMLYLSVIVLIPLAAVAVKAFRQSPGSFWARSQWAGAAALAMTLGASLIVPRSAR